MRILLAFLLSLAFCVRACWPDIDPKDETHLEKITNDWKDKVSGGGDGDGGDGDEDLGGGETGGGTEVESDIVTFAGTLGVYGGVISGGNVFEYHSIPDRGRAISVSAYLPTTLYIHVRAPELNHYRAVLLVLKAPDGNDLVVINPEHNRLLPFFRQGLRVAGDYMLMVSNAGGQTAQTIIRVSAR